MSLMNHVRDQIVFLEVSLLGKIDDAKELSFDNWKKLYNDADIIRLIWQLNRELDPRNTSILEYEKFFKILPGMPTDAMLAAQQNKMIGGVSMTDVYKEYTKVLPLAVKDFKKLESSVMPIIQKLMINHKKYITDLGL